MIELKNVSVIYNNKIKAIDNIDLEIKNHCVGIIGENGSGKSTLLSSLVGLVEHNGEIKVNDVIVDDNNIVTIRNYLGYVFQNPDNQLFMPTVIDDLNFGLINQGLDEEKRNEIINNICDNFDLYDLLKRNPNELSGGQKRMVALASVLCMKPKVLLLDEPTSFLDPKSRRKVMNTLNLLEEDMVIATHDLDLAYDLCDEIILINKGKIVAYGSAKDILLNKELLESNGLELPFRFQED